MRFYYKLKPNKSNLAKKRIICIKRKNNVNNDRERIYKKFILCKLREKKTA